MTAARDRGGDEPQLRVVLADANAPLRTGVRLALEGHGFIVCAEATSGPAAVAAALRERPDVCLVDVRLPGGGIAAAREIAARVPEAAVVALAPEPEASEVLEALNAGARGYLLKDIPPERLPVALRAVLEGEIVLPRSLVGVLVDELRRANGLPALARRTSEQLTTREWEVLQCMREGLSTGEIAHRLYISDVTVRRHAGRVLRKLRVSSREEAVRVAGGLLSVHES